MKYYCFLFNVLVFFFFLTKINGQKQDGYELRGKVFDHENQPLPGATINVMGSKIGAISGVDGDFFLQLDKEGTYTLEISSMGFQTQQQTILINRKTTNVTIQLEEAIAELKQVVVEAASEKLTLETGALSIESIDLKIIRAEAADLPAVLNRTAGVNIRQSAGLGSRARININGLQDKAIEFFRDGIPVDYLGDAFNIALLSPNTLDRVDIYKGVIPAELGGDVLGAGLNFIT
ncbi:MAG: TonB-dependent receptor, partial [Bacteroidota bacterium]